MSFDSREAIASLVVDQVKHLNHRLQRHRDSLDRTINLLCEPKFEGGRLAVNLTDQDVIEIRSVIGSLTVCCDLMRPDWGNPRTTRPQRQAALRRGYVSLAKRHLVLVAKAMARQLRRTSGAPRG